MNSKYTVEQIYTGVKLAYKRMLEQKAKNGEEIVICENGKIIHLNAKIVLEELKFKGEL